MQTCRIGVCVVLVASVAAAAAEPLEPIRTVEIGPHRELRVNGKPFFPLMSWLQEPKRYPKLRGLNFNTFCGNHGVSAKAMLEAARAAGGYAIPHFDANAAGRRSLLAWIHGDEPDLPRTVSDAKVTPGKGLVLNRSTPLWRIVDGVTHSWSVLDPLAGAEVTIELPKPVTARELAVWLTVSRGLAVAKDVVFLGDGKEIARATLTAKKGAQKVALAAPATFRKLALRVSSVHKGQNEWGSVSEIQAFDAAGKNVLLSPPRVVPRKTPEQLAASFRALKQADASRPVFVTFTAYFMEEFGKYDAAARKRLYPALVRSCDVVGFDVYPIYGWNKPEWIDYVAKGTAQLCALAGPKRPVYVWIETSKGTKWVSYEKQKDVLPRHTRGEVWMAIIRGATAIGYFTHAWRPTFTEFRPTEEMQRELKRLNGQITRLAPALLAAPAGANIRIEMPGGIPCHARATSSGGGVYVFAQNIDVKGRSGTATIHVPALKAHARVEVIDEGRTLTAKAGRFADTFAALQEHVYRIPPAE